MATAKIDRCFYDRFMQTTPSGERLKLCLQCGTCSGICPLGYAMDYPPQRLITALRADDWFIEKHPKLDPVATMTEGVFIAGCVQGPKDIPASVAQGAAAARVLGRIQQKEIALEPIRASINQEQCSGCRICNSLCPFNAILFHAGRMLSEVNPALCQGCGTCVAACPAGAISGTGFSNEQVLAQIEGLLVRHLEAVPA